MQKVTLASYKLPDPTPIADLMKVLVDLDKQRASKVEVRPIERGPDNFLSVVGFREDLTPVELDEKINHALQRIGQLEDKITTAMIQIAAKPDHS